jgi:hypothetical protein
MRTNTPWFAFALGTLAYASGCQGMESEDPPVLLLRNMHHQPKYNSQSYSDFFDDHRTMRPPPGNTVSRESFTGDVELESGLKADNSGYVMDIPTSVAAHFESPMAMVERGRERFGIYCTPCHDKTGKGNGTVVLRGFQKPPSLHDARIKQMPDGQLYATIANGVRNMPSYAAQIPLHDRWAIVSYVRALEMTQISMTEPTK